MSKSALLRLSEVHAVLDLAHECQELGDDPNVWRSHYAAGVARLTDADAVIVGEMGGIGNQVPVRLAGIGHVTWGFDHGFNVAGWGKALELLKDDPGYPPSVHRYMALGRLGSSAPRRELLADTDWYRSNEYQLVQRTLGTESCVWGFSPVRSDGSEVSGHVILRATGRPEFTARQVAIASSLQHAVAPLVGRGLARFGEPTAATLPPRVRQVLECLLEGDSAKQVAKRLRISPHTVNQYVKALYRHFGVSSRAELLARWVKRGWGNPPR